MENNIEKFSYIKREELDERFYFKSLVDKACELEIFNISDVNNIQLQCLELLKQRVERYNGLDSTSIRKEKADCIMNSNMYTISLYLKSLVTDDAIKELKQSKISILYKKGRKLLNRKIEVSRVIYHKVLKNKLQINNSFYNETIIGGISGFFKIYDPDFDATNIIITADYPLYNNLIGKLDGIEFIEKYLLYIYHENEFCQMFSKMNIRYLLYGYFENYSELVINIFEIVLTSAIGCILANEEIKNLTVSNSGLQKIYEILNGLKKEDIYNLIYNCYEKLKKEYLKENIELQSYIEKNISQVQSNIFNAVKQNTLDRVFVITKFF